MITQLCASTGWILANIGTKYLKIVYHGLKMSDKYHEEDKNNLVVYEIVCKAI